MDIIIPVLIMVGFVAVIVYSLSKTSSNESRREEEELREKRYAHEPMDLRPKKEE